MTALRENRWDGLRAWIAVWWDLDIATAPQLREELDGKHDAVEIVVDLSGVTFMDTQGLHAVLEAHRDMRAGYGSSRVRRPRGSSSSPPSRMCCPIIGG